MPAAVALDERRRPRVEPVYPPADLVPVLDVDLPVVRLPEAVRRHRRPPLRRAERFLDATPHGGKQQRRVMLARHDEDAVRPRRRESRQCVDDVRMRRNQAVEAGERLRLRAPQRRIVVFAARVPRPGQVERVAVQEEVRRPCAFRVERGEELGELVPPTEVLPG